METGTCVDAASGVATCTTIRHLRICLILKGSCSTPPCQAALLGGPCRRCMLRRSTAIRRDSPRLWSTSATRARRRDSPRPCSTSATRGCRCPTCVSSAIPLTSLLCLIAAAAGFMSGMGIMLRSSIGCAVMVCFACCRNCFRSVDPPSLCPLRRLPRLARPAAACPAE